MSEMGEWVLDQLERLEGPYAETRNNVVCELTRVMSYEDACFEVDRYLEDS
jgi:hypothetical protein